MPTPIPPPQPPTVPTGRELYDALMSHIEPELVTEYAKTLDEHYKNETPENHTQRMKRYDLAFERYEEAYREYMATLDAQVTRYRKQAFSHTESQDRFAEESVLDQLGNFFQHATL
ncbi:MAG: hypothetical protein HOO67_08160 [Candidatus Peribacteraceae bacterium]|nr:hypothetical protein [Candidatus Peribacteraceae bacterium]